MVFTGSCDEDPDRERELIGTFRARRVDGIVLVPASSVTTRELITRIFVELGAEPRLRVMPHTLLALLAAVNPTLRAVRQSHTSSNSRSSSITRSSRASSTRHRHHETRRFAAPSPGTGSKVRPPVSHAPGRGRELTTRHMPATGLRESHDDASPTPWQARDGRKEDRP